MKILYSPIVWDKNIEYAFGAEKVSVTMDGVTDEFDFTTLPDENTAISDILVATLTQPIVSVKRINGETYVTVLNPISDDATEEEKFPEWIEV